MGHLGFAHCHCREQEISRFDGAGATLPIWLWARSGSPNPTLDSALGDAQTSSLLSTSSDWCQFRTFVKLDSSAQEIR
jgi:hypothetical protein